MIDKLLALRIAIIGSRGYPYTYSGYETFVKELSERIVNESIHVTVYCHKNLFTSFPKNVNGIDLVYIRTFETKILSQFIHSFQSIIHASLNDFDIIFVLNSANGPFGLITKIFRKKTVINVDGLEWLRPKWKGIGSVYFYFASKIATKLYDVIVTDSFAMQKIYEKKFRASSTVISYGANIITSVSKSSIMENLDLHGRDFYLVVGRLIPDNNSDLIIAEFLKSNSDKKLVIVGDVPYKDKFAESIKSIKNEKIIFTGYIYNQNDLTILYKNCFAYIHGHEFGGTNPTILTALANGCVIIALDTVFSKEVLNDGKYGIFFTKHPNNLRDCINDLENNAYQLEELRNSACDRIIANYTWEKVVNEYKALFYEVVNHN